MCRNRVAIFFLSCLVLRTDGRFRITEGLKASKPLRGFRLIEGTESPITPEEFGKQHGYFAETHKVTTPDGYILGIHRVLNRNVDLRTSPEPFILQHGLFANSGQWIILEPRQSLPFILADNGFDVWMTNIRGNMYSRNHESLSTKSPDFWDYSWHEHGVIDMPAMIDYVLNATGHKQVWYSGHSMGTTMFFVMGSMRPEYNKKIRHFFALAPVAYMSHLKSGIRELTSYIRFLETSSRSVFNNHFETDFILAQFVRHGFCNVAESLCGEAANAGMGYNPKGNSSIIRVGKDYFPDYASARQLAHYAQSINNEFTFRQYDYYEMNQEKYGDLTPPIYVVERITAPMTFLYSDNDYLAAVEDVTKFSERIPNKRMYHIPDADFNHLDFIASTYADEMVYKPMLKMIADIRRGSY